MSDRIRDAANTLIEEIFMATGLPDRPFTIVITIDPEYVQEGTQYVIEDIVVNEEIWSREYDEEG